MQRRTVIAGCLTALSVFCIAIFCPARARAADGEHRYLYVASPGIRNYLEYGGHGLLVFDIDNAHAFVRRIPTSGLDDEGNPLNVKGICGCAATKRIYISTLQHLQCIDLVTDQLVWQRTYEGGCDRMAITPDGKTIYLPTLERDHWKVIDAASGDELTRIVTNSGAHNTAMGRDGRFVYLAGLRSPLLVVVDTSTHMPVRKIGPFSDSIRPFTINGSQTLCFVNINELLGFEIGDLRTGKKLHRVEVTGYDKGPVKRHGCPSHGIAMTPDEKEIWVSDAANSCVHVFDATSMPPRQTATIPLRDQPGWITFSRDGAIAWPSTGDVIDIPSRRVVAQLTDEQGRPVQSEKVLEVHVRNGEITFVGDQFGIGDGQERRE